MAALLGVSEEVLLVAESDPQKTSPTLLDRCACLLGVTLRDLLAGHHGYGPAALFRRANHHEPLLDSMGRENHLGLVIGSVVRDLAAADRLDGREARLPEWAVERQIPEGSAAPHGARELAAEVRAHLGLGIEPIRSVWDLAAASGVRCAAVTPDLLPQHIDGLSWRSPSPGLVVNLVGGARTWWRTRMTVAHELAHVWFDLPRWGLVVSAEKESSPLYWWFEQIEQRANAFAAYLLVPPEGVVEIAAGRGATPAVVVDLASHFAVGLDTAAQTACNVFNIPREERLRLSEQLRSRPSGAPDHRDADSRPTPREQLVEAVGRAMRQGRLDTVGARIELGLRMSEPLPAGLPDVAPLVDTLTRVRHLALRRLRDAGRDDVVPDRVELIDGGAYKVEVVPIGPAREGVHTGEAGEGIVIKPADLAS